MKTLTKRSEALKARTKAEHTRELVMAMLEWDEVQYGEFVMEKAHEYLKLQCGADAYGIEMLMQCKTFWSWWKNHWAQRDDRYLFQCIGDNDINDLRCFYRFIHCADNLNVRPNKVIMEASYAKMIGRVIDGKEVAQW